MDIATESGIDGSSARALREQRRESQHVFWGRVGVSQSGGCRYESGTEIPRYIRIPLFAIYVAGLNLDAGTPEGVDAMKRLANLQHAGDAHGKADIVRQATNLLRRAGKLLAAI